MNSVIGAYKRNVIGGGYALQAKQEATRPTRSSRQHGRMVQETELRCDRNAVLHADDENVRETKKVDGGILIVKRYTKDGYLPFKLQTFEVDELDNSQMLPKKKETR